MVIRFSVQQQPRWFLDPVDLLQVSETDQAQQPISEEWAIVDVIVAAFAATTLVRLAQLNKSLLFGEEIPSSDVDKQQSSGCLSFGCTLLDWLVQAVQYLYSLLILGFSVAAVMTLLFQGRTASNSADWPSIAVFFIFWGLLVWLVMVEGGMCALVGLQKVERRYYQDSHGIAYTCVSLVRKEDYLERFIVGRQLLVVLAIFVITTLCTAKPGANVFGMPSDLASILIESNFCLITIIVILGQLVGQVTAAACMLDIANNFVLFVTIWISLLVEYSGLLHSVRAVSHFVTWYTGRQKLPQAGDQPHEIGSKVFFWVRVVGSVAILGYSCVVTLDTICRGWTAAHGLGPPWASIILGLVLLCVLGLLEGMQIALFAVAKKKSRSIQNYYPWAHFHLETFAQEKDLHSLLVGRQVLVTVCLFTLAKIGTAVPGLRDPGAAAWHFQALADAGLLGALATTTLGSLVWRVLASMYPLAFLSNPLMGPLMYLCLLIDATGVWSASNVLSWLQRLLLRLRPDDQHALLT